MTTNRQRQHGRHEGRVGLARALSKMGYCSRSAACGLIREGRVRLNGVTPRNPEAAVRLGRDRIEVDGMPVVAGEKSYWMLNKLRGTVATAADEEGRETVYASLPAELPWMGPVGRLDRASEGLLLFSNDSEWAARITAPESHLEKTYHVQVNGHLDETLRENLTLGTRLQDGEALRAKSVRLLRAGEKNCWLEVILDEGKNRHIRRMMEACGLKVLRLIRVAIGPLQLGALAKGEARGLSKEEKKQLDQALNFAAKRRYSEAQ